MIITSDLPFFSFGFIRKIDSLTLDRHCFFDEALMHRFNLCMDIKELTVEKNDSLSYLNFYSFTKLKRLYVRFDDDNVGKFRLSFKTLKDKKLMEELKLDSYYLTKLDLEEIAKFVNLKFLELKNCVFPKDVFFDILKPLKKLEILIINKCGLADVFKIPEYFKKLKVLNLNKNQIDLMPSLTGMRFLKSLSLSGNLLWSMGFVGGIDYLELLDLSNNKIDKMTFSKHKNKKNHVYDFFLKGNPIKDIMNLYGENNFKCENLTMDINCLPSRQYYLLMDKKMLFDSFEVDFVLEDGSLLKHKRFWEYKSMMLKEQKDIFWIKNRMSDKDEFIDFLGKLLI